MENIETIPSPTMMSSLGKLGEPHQPHPVFGRGTLAMT